MLFSRVSASLISVTDLSLHRRSAGAPARGHILERKLVESTYSPQRQASPPTTREYCSAVPEGGKGEGRRWEKGEEGKQRRGRRGERERERERDVAYGVRVKGKGKMGCLFLLPQTIC